MGSSPRWRQEKVSLSNAAFGLLNSETQRACLAAYPITEMYSLSLELPDIIYRSAAADKEGKT